MWLALVSRERLWKLVGALKGWRRERGEEWEEGREGGI